MTDNISGFVSEPVAPQPEKRVWGFWTTAGFGAVILFVFFFVQAVVGGITGFVMAINQQILLSDALPTEEVIELFLDVFMDNLGLIQSIATIVSGIAGIGLVVMFIKVRHQSSIKEYLALKKISVRGVLLVLAIVVGYIMVVSGLNLFFGESTDEQIVYDIYKTSVWPVLFWIAVIIFAPAFEEVFFRGFLFEGFRQSRIGAVGATLITAMVWSLIHVLQYNLFSIGLIFILGIVMGIVRLKTRSIWSTVIMHALYNAVGVTLIALSV